MELFDFDFHTFQTRYPESGVNVQLGNAYRFSTRPEAPNQRTIILGFNQGMQYFYKEAVDEETPAEPDDEINPRINFWRFEKFYQRHELWQRFEYQHPFYGLMVVTFAKPLETPKPRPGGFTDAFTIELLEQP